jgi:ABC-type multidrug transport system fused ATPase/permease subunit
MGYIKEIFFLMGQKKKVVPYILFLFIFVSFIDILGIGLIGPYISIIIDDQIQEGKIGKTLLFLGFSEERNELLISVGLWLVALFFIKSILAIIVNRIILGFSASMQVQIRSSLMKIYQNLPYSAYLTRNSSEYIHAINNLVGIFQTVVTASLRLISDLILVSAIVILLAFQDILALSILVILLVTLVILYDRVFQSKLKIYGQKTNIASSELLKSIAQGLEGLKEIRILGKEKLFYDKVLNSSKELALYSVKEGVIASAPRFLLEFFMVSFIVLLVIITLWTEQELNSIIVTLAMFSVATLRLLPSASSISGNLILFRFNRDVVSKLYKDLNSINETDENILSSKAIKNAFQKITFDRVNFAYSSKSIEVLKNISLKINNGDCVGIIGSSGSGKTTLIDLLLGLLNANSGSIEYNEIPIEKSLKELRSKVAYLPQEVFLLDDTIRNNVALGDSEDKIDNEQVLDSLNKARLLEFTNQLPRGIETVLGERGSRLSGGQRQRVALARAFYHQREILVMDEATSALDTKTEREIVNEIRYLKGKKTIIVIAHRLSTLQYCDIIYELDKGQIVRSGSPEKILKLNKI